MYNGGKNGSGVYQWIINQIPPHTRYIEAFAGDATIARLKRRAKETMLIERDETQTRKLHSDGFYTITIDVLEYLRQQEYILMKKSTFLYLDPPYLFSTRSSKTPLYKHEFGTDEQHRELLTLLRSLHCNIAISGYASELYSEMLHDWRVTTYRTIKRSGKPALEHLWMNYPEPTTLHDYQYLGSNYREREKIRRQQKRWRERLATMDAQQRYAMLSVIQEL